MVAMAKLYRAERLLFSPKQTFVNPDSDSV